MWGGIKHARDYSHHFTEWSSNKPVELLRKALFREPRPWYLGFSLDKHNHVIDDRVGERLMRWCTTIVALQPTGAKKKDVYRNSQELFSLMAMRRTPSDATLAQFLSLCEVGGDVSTAYKWIRYVVDLRIAQLPPESNTSEDPSGGPLSEQPYQLWHYVWLLRVVVSSPSDDAVDEMVHAVREVYETIFCPRPDEEDGHDASAEFTHMVCRTYQESLMQRELFVLIKKLMPRMQDDELRRWCMLAESSLKISSAVAEASLADVQRAMHFHWVFPQLEGRIMPSRIPASSSPELSTSVAPSIQCPYLVDSLFNPAFQEKLQRASFTFNVQEVGFCVQAFLEDIAAEKAKQGAAAKIAYRHTPSPTNPMPVWRDYRDVSHQEFRKCLVEAQGVSAELYHYLIVALSQSSPRLALMTKKKMVDQGMRILDLTRAVLIVACKESAEEQKALLVEQKNDFAQRAQLDADYETPKVVEAFWKFEYHELFYQRNAAKSMRDFYVWLMDALGVADVQRLIASTSDVPMEEDEVAALDDDARDAACLALRKRRGTDAVERALDEITEHCPMLDLALINALPHLSEYTLANNEDIATSLGELKRRLFPSTGGPLQRDVYLMDSSFIEASERFFTVAANNDDQSMHQRTIVIPWFCLKHLAETADGRLAQCMDPETFAAQAYERSLATSRLQQISTLLSRQRTEGYAGPTFVVLHFSECLLAQAIPSTEFPTLLPESSDNDLMASILLILTTMCASPVGIGIPQPRAFLCTDDPQLIDIVTNERASTVATLLKSVTVISTPRAEDASVADNNNPEDAVKMVNSVAAEFQPKLDTPSAVPREHTNLQPVVDTNSSDAPQETEDVPGLSAEDLFDGDSATIASVAPTTAAVAANNEQSHDPASWLSMLDSLDVVESSSPPPSAIASTHVVFPQDSLQSHSSGRALADETAEGPNTLLVDGDDQTNESDRLLFSEFGVESPDQRLEREMKRHSGKGHDDAAAVRRPSPLGIEAARNKGFNKKKRLDLARKMSNSIGRRVPFHFKYNVYEANLNDPRNTHLRQAFNNNRRR